MDEKLELGADVRDALAAITDIAAVHSTADVAGSREFYRAMAVLAGVPQPLYSVEDVWIADPGGGPLRLRLYRPRPGALPAVLFCHGGWFFMGGIETHDAPLRELAETAGCVVVAVDYRLAPEQPWPAAPDDCAAAAVWLAENTVELGLRPGGLAVCGDSAGGALAAAVARRARDCGGPALLCQVLVYPVLDMSLDTESWRTLSNVPIISRERAEQAWSMYLPGGHVTADAAPGNARDSAGLPPLSVITAEYDPLRDEGEAYAAALRRAGVPATVSRYPGMIHGFFQMAGFISSGHQAIAEVAASLRTAFFG